MLRTNRSYWPQLLICQTESEVEGVARHLADELKKDAEKFPSVVGSVVDQKINRLANVRGEAKDPCSSSSSELDQP